MNASLGDRAPITERACFLRRSSGRVSSWLNARTRAGRKIPIRGRIALFGAGVVALAVVIFSSLVYVLVERSLITQQDEALKTRGDEVLRMLESRGGFRPSPFAMPIDIGKSSELFVEITVFNPSQVYSSGKVNNTDPILPADLLESASSDHGTITNVRAENGPLMRVYLRQLVTPTGPAGSWWVGRCFSATKGDWAGFRSSLLPGGWSPRLGPVA